MMQQYLSIKGQYPDAILFYRMGDFYEMFFEDAEVASGILKIALTSRNKNEETPIPMCGVPYKAAQGYIARLLASGRKVAVCDQVEDPAAAKGLVKREVVRVITPGMIVENEFLDEKSNNFLLSLACHGNLLGLACLDLSTGTFRLTENAAAVKIADECRRIAPSEVLVPESARDNAAFEAVWPALEERAVNLLEDRRYDLRRCRQLLTRQFETVSLEGFGCEDRPAGILAAGTALEYVHETQKQKVTHIAGLETYSLEQYLWLDELSCRNLELTANIRTGSRQGTLLGVLDRTCTAMGGRLLKQWLRYPLLEAGQIEARLEAVEELCRQTAERSRLRETLKSVYDLERLGSKISMGHGNARDLLALKNSLEMLPQIRGVVQSLQAGLFAMPEGEATLLALAERIDAAIREDAPPVVNEGGMIKIGFDPRLDELIRLSRDGKQWLARLEVRERDATGINALKVRYNKVFGYFLEVPKARSSEVPAHYVRKQTLVNAERYITEELKDFETRVLNAENERSTLEYEIFSRLRDEVVQHGARVQTMARYLARLDCLVNLAEAADRNNYFRPQINDQGILSIEDGRHPVVEKMITGERFVPNSIRLDNTDNQVLVITGPNMAGKSTVLRQVALTVVMAHMGSFVPARKASVCLTDRIFTRVGALDNLAQGQSTFMVEMQETANILNHATENSLVILDEIGRGTSTFDGMSIAWAVAEHLHDHNDRGVKSLFATHYHELTELARTRPRVKNFNIAVKEWNDEIIFLRKLVEGGTNRSYGIQVARLAGIPPPVIRRAKHILTGIEDGRAGVFAASRRPRGARPRQEDKQLSLFRKPEDVVVERLQTIDISALTPLEALNLLDELLKLSQASAKRP
jgi:DNA mismatch repair protein MutS